MKAGYLSEYFRGVAAKYLSAVEADVAISHQHEFNGVNDLKKLFGTGKEKYEAVFIYLNDTDDEPVTDTGFLTWYDARERHPTRTEYRLYFPTTRVSMCTEAGDLLVIGLKPDNTVLVIIAEGGSTISNQIRWLFGLELAHPGFSIRAELESEQDRIAFASAVILEQIGIQIETTQDTFLDKMLSRFNGSFPKTAQFSAYARETLPDIDPLEDPDGTLMAWIEREEILFRTLEKHLIADRLSAGFDGDVDGFLKFSLSVQNRRKSRVGFALENHLEALFSTYHITYDRTQITENRSKPDFIFPGIKQYRDLSFDPLLLTMLGVKSTCKDRWRQVLSEADRIEKKHLFTLEAAISENQTDEMISRHLQLVVPESIIKTTYSIRQQAWLMNVRSFLDLAADRQRRAL